MKLERLKTVYLLNTFAARAVRNYIVCINCRVYMEHLKTASRLHVLLKICNSIKYEQLPSNNMEYIQKKQLWKDINWGNPFPLTLINQSANPCCKKVH